MAAQDRALDFFLCIARWSRDDVEAHARPASIGWLHECCIGGIGPIGRLASTPRVSRRPAWSISSQFPADAQLEIGQTGRIPRHA